MERITINKARDLFGINFIGIEELNPLFMKMGISVCIDSISDIHYSLTTLQRCAKDYILILGLSDIGNKKLSIRTFINFFGTNLDVFEPCFYNQDWYLKEDFIDITLDNRWYLIKKEIIEKTRAVQPIDLIKQNIFFPSAVLCTYTFFAYYFLNKDYLWCHDFVWCSDKDHNGDRIYVGKYRDVDGVNKDGFSIHRHLNLRNCYASINIL